MMIDGHIHLENGPYTYEWLMTFVQQAQKTGVNEIWVLDHTHRFFEFMPIYEDMKAVNEQQKQWLTEKRLFPLSSYTNFIRDMRKRTFPIKIRFGLEVCYFPQHNEKIKQVLDTFNFDFVVGSVHAINNMAYDLSGISEDTLWNTHDIDWIYDQYFDTMKALIQSNLFNGMGHPDTIKMFNRYPTYDWKDKWNEIADLLNEHHMYTENNVGCHYRYNHEDLGLNDEVLKIFREKHVKLVTATDAHIPQHVGKLLSEIKSKTYG